MKVSSKIGRGLKGLTQSVMSLMLEYLKFGPLKMANRPFVREACVGYPCNPAEL